MKVQFTRQGRGFVVTRPNFLLIALLRGAVDGRPVLGWYAGSGFRHQRIFRPFSR